MLKWWTIKALGYLMLHQDVPLFCVVQCLCISLHSKALEERISFMILIIVWCICQCDAPNTKVKHTLLETDFISDIRMIMMNHSREEGLSLKGFSGSGKVNDFFRACTDMQYSPKSRIYWHLFKPMSPTHANFIPL